MSRTKRHLQGTVSRCHPGCTAQRPLGNAQHASHPNDPRVECSPCAAWNARQQSKQQTESIDSERAGLHLSMQHGKWVMEEEGQQEEMGDTA